MYTETVGVHKKRAVTHRYIQDFSLGLLVLYMYRVCFTKWKKKNLQEKERDFIHTIQFRKIILMKNNEEDSNIWN